MFLERILKGTSLNQEHVVCTIIAPNYLSQALSLGESLIKNMQSVAFRILVLKDSSDNSFIDDILQSDDYKHNSNSSHSTLSIQSVNWEDFNLLGAINKYDLLEFATSVKPSLISHLLNQGWKRVTYLDPDTQVHKDFSKLLSDEHPISVTPHILRDFPVDQRTPNSQSILYAGIFNLGFISCTIQASGFLKWWAWKLENFCTMDVLEGYHVDQKWVDWAPAFCDTQILRNPGLNVAYWNLHERSIRQTSESTFVSVEEELTPLYFFHFSGFDDFENLHISKHTTRDFSETIIPRIFIKQYAEKRIFWNKIIDKFEGMGRKLTEWSLGGRPEGRAISIVERQKLMQGARNLLQAIDSPTRVILSKQNSRIVDKSLDGPSIGWLLEKCFTRKQIKSPTKSEIEKIAAIGYSDNQVLKGLEYAESFLSSLPRIKLVGYFSAPTGVGQIARNTAALLQRSGVPFTAECVSTPFDSEPLKRVYDEIYLKPTGTEDLTIAFVNADMWLLDAVTSRKVDRNRQYVSGVWAWEIDAVPTHYVEVAKNVDQLFALSEFSAQALQKAMGKPVKVLPTYCSEIEFPKHHGVSRSELNSAFPQLPQKYILCRFDAKSVIARKNPEGVLEVWKKICHEYPDYKVVFKTIDFEKIAHKELFEKFINQPGIILLDNEIKPQLNDALMTHASAYISLHRAEGLGLNILEAIFSDIPAVYTNYSGLSRELEGVGFKVDFQLAKIGADSHPYPPDAFWAEPNLEHAVEQLRSALELIENGQWKMARVSRAKWVQEFLDLNSEIAKKEIMHLLDSVALVEHRFDRFIYLKSGPFKKIYRRLSKTSILWLWKKLPIGLRRKWKPIVLRIYFGVLKRDVNISWRHGQ